MFAWVPSIGVSNLIEVANFHPAWDGDLLVGSLRAQALHRLRRDGDGRVVYSEPIQLGQRLRDIAALPDGTLAIWTDSARLMFLSVDRARLAANDYRFSGLVESIVTSPQFLNRRVQSEVTRTTQP